METATHPFYGPQVLEDAPVTLVNTERKEFLKLRFVWVLGAGSGVPGNNLLRAVGNPIKLGVVQPVHPWPVVLQVLYQ